MVLWRSGDGAVHGGTNGIAGQSGSQISKTVHQFGAGFHGINGSPDHLDDIALIHAGRHIHGGNPGFAAMVENGPLHRSGAPELGKNAGVHIDTAQRRQIQHRLGQQLAIGHHQNQIRLQCAERVQRCLVLERRRLKDGNPLFQRVFLHRRHGQLHPAVLRRVRLRKHTSHLIAGLADALETCAGNLGRSHKYQFHSSSSSLASSSNSSGVSIRSATAV